MTEDRPPYHRPKWVKISHPAAAIHPAARRTTNQNTSAEPEPYRAGPGSRAVGLKPGDSVLEPIASGLEPGAVGLEHGATGLEPPRRRSRE